jgi:Spy/CpxP family protein refolding chaperone
MENVMSRMMAMLASGIMLAGVTFLGFAQERGEGRRLQATSGPDGDQTRPLERILKELNLTEDQQKQVQQIMGTQRQAVRNWRNENQAALKDLQKQLQDAKDSGDKDKIKAANQGIEKIKQSRKALYENVMKQLKDVLTPDQLEKARKFMQEAREQAGEVHRGPLRLIEGLKALDLTEDQKTQARAILDAARKKADAATDPTEKDLIMKVAREKIETDVLTDAQRIQVRRLEFANAFLKVVRKLNLTDGQKKQIGQIMDDAKTQADKAKTEQEKKEIHRQAFKKVHDTVLTQEQQEQLKEMQKNAREGRGRLGDRGPGRGPRSGVDSRPGATSRPDKERGRPAPEPLDDDAPE